MFRNYLFILYQGFIISDLTKPNNIPINVFIILTFMLMSIFIIYTNLKRYSILQFSICCNSFFRTTFPVEVRGRLSTNMTPPRSSLFFDNLPEKRKLNKITTYDDDACSK